ncbi:hypothetical protein CsatB_009904 [Cannabis sativa]
MSPDMRQHGIGGLSMQCKGNEQYAIHNHLFAMEWKAIQVTYQHQRHVIYILSITDGQAELYIMMKMNDSSRNDDNNNNNKGKNVKDIENEDLLNFKYPTSNIEEDDISKYFLENNDVGRIMEDIFKESPLPPHYSQHSLSNSIQNLNKIMGLKFQQLIKMIPCFNVLPTNRTSEAPEMEISIDFAEAVLQNFQLSAESGPKTCSRLLQKCIVSPCKNIAETKPIWINNKVILHIVFYNSNKKSVPFYCFYKNYNFIFFLIYTSNNFRTDTVEEIFTNYIDTRLISLLFIDDKL